MIFTETDLVRYPGSRTGHAGYPHQAVSEYRERDLSFAANVQIVRIAQPQSGAFPPSAAPKARALV